MEGRFETVVGADELTLAHADIGSGPSVVLLHALGRSSEDWQDVIADLSSSFRCIAVDLPGHGQSSRAGRYSFELIARATLRLIDHLGVDSLAIVAHSMGATTALALAPDLGPRLWALVVEDTGVPSGRISFAEVPAEPAEVVAYDWEARRQIIDELNHPDPAWYKRLVEITAPTLMMVGRPGDADIDATVDRLPDAEAVTVPVGHWIHQDAPEQFISTVRAFLERSQPAD